MNCKLPNVEPERFDFKKFENDDDIYEYGLKPYKEFVDFYHLKHNEEYSEIHFFEDCFLNINSLRTGMSGDEITIDVQWIYKEDDVDIEFTDYWSLSLFIQFLLDFVRDNVQLVYKMRKELKKIGRKEKTDHL